MKIIFMGTPEFAVPCLDILVQNKYDVVAVVTMPDKPAGRGQQLQQSAVKKYALQHNLKVLQPEKLKSEAFLDELKTLKADLQIVVAFRMLPEIVWNMPPLGTYNLHASLLPQYRGAAPINWVLINGEEETGATTFKLQQEIDTGNILFQQKVKLTENTNAGELHDQLMNLGGQLILKTVRAIEANVYPLLDQNQLILNADELKHAPKIYKETCRINWENMAKSIHNLIRGLSPYPAAWTELRQEQNVQLVKIFSSTIINKQPDGAPGKIISDNKTFINVVCKEGLVGIHELQLAGKKRLSTNEFLKGFNFKDEDFFC